MRLSRAMPIALMTVASASQAQVSPNIQMPVPSSAALAASRVLSRGEVLKVDQSSGTVTLKHGVITNMKMPAMTMSFGVADKKLLERVKAGDKVRFHVEKVNGAPTVTYIKTGR